MVSVHSLQQQGGQPAEAPPQTAASQEPQQSASVQNGESHKFPIETYAGLEAATAERIKKFEAETKAMMGRPVTVIAKSGSDTASENGKKHLSLIPLMLKFSFFGQIHQECL